MHFRLLWLSVLTLLALFASPDDASAQNGAWCARLRGGDSCGFATFEQCRATISGDGGICIPNPRGPARAGSGPPAVAPGAAAAAAAAAKRAKAEQAEKAREAAEERRRARQKEKELARQRERAPAAGKAAPTAPAPAAPVPAATVSGSGIAVADLDVNAVPALNREAVRRVQIVLKEKGFDPGPLNGVPNPRLQAAVRTFQSRYGIEARGEIDNQTLLALGEAGLASQSNR
jgi:hypothetical protein